MSNLPQTGLASWYTDDENASGKPVNNATDMTAAHKTLPFGTRIKVSRLDIEKTVIVTVEDRGPWSGNRILDLRPKPAAILDMKEDGVIPVRIEVVDNT